MRSTLRSWPAALAAITVLLACSGSAPPIQYYLLRGDAPPTSGRLQPDVRVGLGRVAVAPYLAATQGIVIETEPGIVRAARHHQWAEPLVDGISAFLRTEIGAALGQPLAGRYEQRATWDYRIDVSIDRLHGAMDGTALIEARYRVAPVADSTRGGEFLFERRAPLSREGYGGTVDGLGALLRELSAAIADSVGEIAAPATAATGAGPG